MLLTGHNDMHHIGIDRAPTRNLGTWEGANSLSPSANIQIGGQGGI